jgi:hypothetical protein
MISLGEFKYNFYFLVFLLPFFIKNLIKTKGHSFE